VKLDAQRVRAARLEAEANDRPLVFPEGLVDSDVAAAENALFLSRREKLNQEITVHENTIRQQTARLSEMNRRKASLAGELQVAHNRWALLSKMAERNAASKLEVLDAQGRERGLETELNAAQSAIPGLNAGIDEERSRIDAIKADFHNQAQNDLVATLAEIDRLKQVKISASDRVRRTEVRAPIDGTINRISVNTVGGVVKPGESLIELIPHTSEVLIEAKAQPKDRGYLRPGLNATVRISAYDVGELGVLKSRVTEVSADTVQDAHGDPYYRVNLLVSDIPPSYKDRMMVPGMTATADIVTGRRTVMGMLLSPLRKFTYSMFRDSR
jgi:adhesin transport system membrane fusion protein